MKSHPLYVPEIPEIGKELSPRWIVADLGSGGEEHSI